MRLWQRVKYTGCKIPHTGDHSKSERMWKKAQIQKYRYAIGDFFAAFLSFVVVVVDDLSV